MNHSHPLFGLKDSEITEDHLEDLTEEQYQEYILWRIQTNLDYMVAEGMVVTKICPVTGETLYMMPTDAPVDEAYTS